jgi:hypothetical protein
VRQWLQQVHVRTAGAQGCMWPLGSSSYVFSAPGVHSSSEEPAQVVVVSTADARLAVVDLESGQHLGE